VAYGLRLARAMKITWLLPPVALAAAAGPTSACPEPCLETAPMQLGQLTHIFDLSYVTGVRAVAATGEASHVDTSVGIDLAYTAQLGKVERPEYQLSVGLGVTAHRIQGSAINANGFATRAGVTLGPAPLLLADTADRFNAVWFPMAFEIAHEGDLAQLPRLSARPDFMRATYGREHVTVSTQMVRIETSGDNVPADRPTGPGGRVPESAAFDVLAFEGSLDATMQDGMRLETSFGGYALRAIGRIATGMRLDLLGYEHREIRLPNGVSTHMGTFWALRADYVNPATGTHYFLGWGSVVNVPEESTLRALLDAHDGPDDDEDEDELSVGGLGFWVDRPWGTVGMQYRRDPFITMAAEPALEDRVFVEATHRGALTYTGRWFLARTLRLSNSELLEDITTGVELDATRRLAGFDVGLHAAIGRTFYAAVDNAAPQVGFAANASLSISRSGTARWSR
jgi:hypothetical protein